ncbi:hypothetical protein FQA39_LY15863 [Lamprigera yunnana]|nr:hypothetical protein FQA39_LY15863 [Lamprigera yunnana]
MESIQSELNSIILLRATECVVHPCITPDREKAYCISLFSCPHLMTAIGTLEPTAVAYVKRSICLGCKAGDVMVCCGTPPQQEPTMNKVDLETVIFTTATTAIDELTNRFNEAIEQRLLPSLKFCGFQQNDDRLHNATTTTAIDEFPWMVHVRLSHNEYDAEFEDRCYGVLISDRYVLTNSYCAVESIKVKLGEYNTNKTVSCELSLELTECTEPVLDLNVEEIIRDGKKSNGPYDFALIRLNQSVSYSDYIRPICLPFEGVQGSKPSSLLISGWGALNSSGVAKKKLKYKIENNDTCYQRDRFLKLLVDRANLSFICTISDSNLNQKDTACGSVRGGPFMYEFSRKHQWFVEGIVVKDMSNSWSCFEKIPIIGIRITKDTIDWILSTIRP